MAGYLPDKDDKGRYITKNLKSDEEHRVRHKGVFDFNVPAGQTVDSDWQIEQLQYQGQNVDSVMTGVQYKMIGGNDGDTIDFCVVDKDNLLGYGAGVVLDGFAENFYMFKEHPWEIREHVAKLIPGLYIRAHVVNNGTEDLRFLGNLLRYLDL